MIINRKTLSSTIIFSLQFSVLILLSACSSVDPYQKVDLIYAKKAAPYHVVQEGETVQSIASKYSMDESEFISINKLTSPYELIPGQRLIVHVKSSDTSMPNEGGGVNVQETSETKESSEKQEINDQNNASETKENDESSQKNINEEAKVENKESVKSLRWPVYGRVVKKYGDQKNAQFSKGISISAPEGTPVYAAKKGVVLKSNVKLDGFGKTVVIQHEDDTLTVYSHLKICLVKVDQNVTTKTVIGRVGKTGGIKKPELHFQLRNAHKKPVNPLSKLG